MQNSKISFRTLASALIALSVVACPICISGCGDDAPPSKQMEIRKQMDQQRQGMKAAPAGQAPMPPGKG